MATGMVGGRNVVKMTIVEGKIVSFKNIPFDFTRLGSGKIRNLEGSEDVEISGDEYNKVIRLYKRTPGEYITPQFELTEGGLVKSIKSYSIPTTIKNSINVKDPVFGGSIKFTYLSTNTDVFIRLLGEISVLSTTPPKEYIFKISNNNHPSLQPTVQTQLYTAEGEDIFNSPYNMRRIFVPIKAKNIGDPTQKIIDSEMDIEFSPIETIFTLRKGTGVFDVQDKILIDYTGLYSKEHTPATIVNYPTKFW